MQSDADRIRIETYKAWARFYKPAHSSESHWISQDQSVEDADDKECGLVYYDSKL